MSLVIEALKVKKRYSSEKTTENIMHLKGLVNEKMNSAIRAGPG